MNSSKLSRFLTLLLIFVAAVAFSSCNRGYGCPNNFSLDTVAEMVQGLVSMF